MEIDFGGERLRLLPQRAVFLAAHGSVLVADVHIGKAASFRRQGVAVPEATTDDTLSRLAQLLALSACRRLVVLGDLVHGAAAQASATRAAVERWRDAHPALEIVLVRGNHEAGAGDALRAWRLVEVEEPWPLGALQLWHHPPRPCPDDGPAALAGHVHPAASLGGRAGDHLRLPCFHFRGRLGLLPAFGAFTGMHTVRREPADRVFVVGDGVVRRLPPTLAPCP